MDIQKYGPFANIVMVAGFLTATFGVLLLKIMGGLSKWTGFAPDIHPFMVALPARVIAIVLMAITYVTIDQKNMPYFLAAALIFAFIAANRFFKFNFLRTAHVHNIPVLALNGQQQKQNDKLVFDKILVSTEDDMMNHAKNALANARQSRPGLDLFTFLSGYGNAINEPTAIWSPQTLATISNQITSALAYTVLSSVMALYLSAFALAVFNQS